MKHLIQVEGIVNVAINKQEIDSIEFAVKACPEAHFCDFFRSQLDVLRHGLTFRSHAKGLEALGQDTKARVGVDTGCKKLELFMRVRRDLVKSMQLAAQVEVNYPKGGESEVNIKNRETLGNCSLLTLFKGEVSGTTATWNLSLCFMFVFAQRA